MAYNCGEIHRAANWGVLTVGYIGFYRVLIGIVGFNGHILRFYEKMDFKQEEI